MSPTRSGVAPLAALLALSGCAGTPPTVEFRGQKVDAAKAADWKSTAAMGGPLRPAQAAYDVQRYDLRVAIYPDDERIVGRNAVTVAVVSTLDVFEIPLDSRLTVGSVSVDGAAPPAMTHAGGLIRVALAEPWRPGEEHVVTIAYGGRPFEALAPPWMDGFVWSRSADGSPWIGTTSQGSGGDLWWPVKDHPSDEPDRGMRITLDVPAGLVGLANGRRVAERVSDGRSITEWEVHYPINQYGVALNAGPFVPIETTYTRKDGGVETIVFWALPEHRDQARAMWLDQGPRILAAFAAKFGEYPFWSDKYWVVETPYLGMEHQGIVAYGSKFKIDEFGFDWLLLHETAHEWWGNKVSAGDWADWWIHEGFGAYAHGVFVDVDAGRERYLEYMRQRCKPDAFRKFVNPVIRGTDQVAEDAYVPEVYAKASCVLHTLRWLMGDEDFYRALYRFLNDERFAYRTVSTADFRSLVADIEGRPYDWFFDRYLHHSSIPRWRIERTRAADHETVVLRWDDAVFQLPIPLQVNGELRRVEMGAGQGSLRVPLDAEVSVDPEGWLLALPAQEPPAG
jgi:aminopeptidase N